MLCIALVGGFVGLSTQVTSAQDLSAEAPLPALEASGPTIQVVLEPDTIAATLAPAPAFGPAAAETGDLPAEWTWSDYLKLLALKLLPTFVYVIGGVTAI
jgi:hypothetical protein